MSESINNMNEVWFGSLRSRGWKKNKLETLQDKMEKKSLDITPNAVTNELYHLKVLPVLPLFKIVMPHLQVKVV